jgi:hypothetical protein
LSRIRQPPENPRPDRRDWWRENRAREQRRGAGARRVAADFVVAVMQVRERFALPGRIGGGGGLGGFERPLDGAQLAVTVLDEFDRRCRRGERLLRDVRDRPRGRELDVPGVLMRLAQDQREEARLAAAVRPTSPTLCPA